MTEPTYKSPPTVPTHVFIEPGDDDETILRSDAVAIALSEFDPENPEDSSIIPAGMKGEGPPRFANLDKTTVDGLAIRIQHRVVEEDDYYTYTRMLKNLMDELGLSSMKVTVISEELFDDTVANEIASLTAWSWQKP